jgi:hypothetical protein
VIADGHELVVGQERRVGAKQAAHRLGVVNAGVEVRVVTDVAGRENPAISRLVQQRAQFARRVGGAQERGHGLPQGTPGQGAQLEQRV